MKKNIALVTGGYSSECQISYLSADSVWKSLDHSKFNFYFIDINPKEWVCKMENKKYPIDKNDFSICIKNETIQFDLCYMMLHGTPGEDGKLQGYFDSIRQPYLSCNAAVSALTFNKFYTTTILQSLGIKVAKSTMLFKQQAYDVKKLARLLQFPVFVKPNNGGSSIGISKVTKQDLLQKAITKAFAEDDQVLLEEQIVGREFTVGICKLKNQIVILPITEIKTQNDFFDFEAKYQGKAIEITPAKITADIKKKIETVAKDIYTKLNCNGVIRVDIIYNEKDKEAYVLEINTVPGQTKTSFIPQQVLAMNMPLKKFYTLLLEECLKAK